MTDKVCFSQENVFLGARKLAPKSGDRCQIGPRSAPERPVMESFLISCRPSCELLNLLTTQDTGLPNGCCRGADIGLHKISVFCREEVRLFNEVKTKL